LNASLYTVIDRAITKTEGRSVQEYVLCSMVFANIYVQDRGNWGVCTGECACEGAEKLVLFESDWQPFFLEAKVLRSEGIHKCPIE